MRWKLILLNSSELLKCVRATERRSAMTFDLRMAESIVYKKHGKLSMSITE
jgi:hypothetical protein